MYQRRAGAERAPSASPYQPVGMVEASDNERALASKSPCARASTRKPAPRPHCSRYSIHLTSTSCTMKSSLGFSRSKYAFPCFMNWSMSTP